MNAMEQGAAEAKGAWILFLDADSCVHRGALRASVLSAERQGYGLLSLSPHQECPTVWEELVQSSVFAFLNLRYPYAEINDPASPVAAANGVFLLVKKEIFERIHGFSWVQRRLVDDVALAEKIKGEGYRIAFFPTHTAVSVRMYKSCADLWAGWSKHFEVFFGEGGPWSFVIAGYYFLVLVLPFLLVPFVITRPLPLVSLALIFLLEARLRKIQGYKPGYFILMPLGNMVFFGVLINALLNRYVRKRVIWKGRTYVSR